MNTYPLSHSEMVTKLVKPGQEIINSLTPDKAHLWHMASCILGEVAELCEGEGGLPVSKEQALEELGDIRFYMEGVRQTFGKSEGILGFKTTDPSDSVLRMLLVNAGQLFDVIKRHVIYNKPLDEDKYNRAMGNMEELICRCEFHFGVTREEVLTANQEKLIGPNGRYHELVYSDTAAQERRDKQSVTVAEATHKSPACDTEGCYLPFGHDGHHQAHDPAVDLEDERIH